MKRYCVVGLVLVGLLFLRDSSIGFAKDEPANNPPLVLGIPGFLVPNVKLTQEEHFGQAKTLLAKQGIPFKVIVYDSKEYPLNVRAADIASYNDYSIAFSRVGPGVLKAINDEKIKRLLNHEPPLKEVVLMMYSQGGVISYSFVRKVYYFKKQYDAWVKNYGEEWEILKKDPEFIYMSEAFRHYHDTYSILTQREKDITKDKNLMLLLQDGMDDLNRRIDALITYLYNPESKYAQVHSLDSPFYPKRYVKFAELAKSVAETRGRNPELADFMMDYSVFQDILDLKFRFFSCASSFFGSPKANAYYGLLKVIPVRGFMNVSDSALKQIEGTQLGSAHHENKLESLARESKFGSFVLNDQNALFVFGANGAQGDGLVEQPSAHLSQHTFMEFDLNPFSKKQPAPSNTMIETGPTVELPDWPRLPLPVRHFASGKGKDRKFGAAYMEEDDPVYHALKAFLHKDFDSLKQMREENKTRMTQFLVEFFVEKGDENQEKKSTPFFLVPFQVIFQALKGINLFPSSPVRFVQGDSSFRMDHTYFNEETDTYVWLGHVDPSQLEDHKTSEMVFQVQFENFHPVKIKVPVRVGSINFVKLIASKAKVD